MDSSRIDSRPTRPTAFGATGGSERVRRCRSTKLQPRQDSERKQLKLEIEQTGASQIDSRRSSARGQPICRENRPAKSRAALPQRTRGTGTALLKARLPNRQSRAFASVQTSRRLAT